MKDKNSLATPLISLDRTGRFQVSDNGRQWIIEERWAGSWSSHIEIEGSSYTCGGTELMDIVYGIRELEIDVDLHGRKALAAFWNSYADYRRERSTKTLPRLLAELDRLIHHAEPVDAAMITSDRQILRMVEKRRKQAETRRQLVYGSSGRHIRSSDHVLESFGDPVALVRRKRSG